MFVGPTAEVLFEGAPYSMPPEATNVPGTLFLYEDRLRIIAGRYGRAIAAARRTSRRRRCRSIEPRRSLPSTASEPSSYEKRQQVLNLGRNALALLTEITHRHGKLAGRHVEDLYALLEAHGDDAMRSAIERAVVDGRLTVVGVRRIYPQERPEARRRTPPCRSGATARRQRA